MAATYLHDQERVDLQADTPSSLNSLHDLRELFYKGKNGLAGTADRKETELMRTFLIAQTGAVGVRSLPDLWRLYLVQQGITRQVSLTDMFKDFWAANKFASAPSILLQNGSHELLQNGSLLLHQ